MVLSMILSCATSLGLQVTVEGSQMCGARALAGASNLLGYKEYTQKDLSTNNNAEYTAYITDYWSL